MQLELCQHLNDKSASEESEIKDKVVKRYCTMSACKNVTIGKLLEQYQYLQMDKT